MDGGETSKITREICSVAASRYAKPPPPIPSLIYQNAGVPPPIPKRQPILPPREPKRPGRAVHLQHRPPPPVPFESPIVAQPSTVSSAWRPHRLATASDTLVTADQVNRPPFHLVPATGTFVTLDQVRSGARNMNDYVDTPIADTSKEPRFHPLTPTTMQPKASVSNKATTKHLQEDDPKLHKDDQLHNELNELREHNSIICNRCGKCRCAKCTSPRECCRTRWLCNRRVECSCQRAVEYVSCFWCLQCTFFNAMDDKDNEYVAGEDPCACCSKPNCCCRWTCIAASTLVLPCLLLYWPLKGLLAGCSKCNKRCSRRGCHCSRANMKPLIDSENSSA